MQDKKLARRSLPAIIGAVVFFGFATAQRADAITAKTLAVKGALCFVLAIVAVVLAICIKKALHGNAR